MNNSSIQELILRIRVDEDITAFNQIYGLYVVKLLEFAYSFLDDKEPAEEIVNDVFLKIWTGREKLDSIKNLQVYLYVSVKNACLNHLRSLSSKRNNELRLTEAYYFQLSVDPAQLLISKELSTDVLKAVNELPARCKPIDADQWVTGYARRRYGKADPQLNEAWNILLNTVYSGGLTEGGNESIIVARPTFEKKIDRVLTHVDYDQLQLLKAWGLFIDAADQFKSSDGFKYDLVDISRQVLANYASPLQQKMVLAYKNKDQAAFKRYSSEFLTLMDDMDALLGTRKDFLLGKWITEARANGITEKGKTLYEFNARDLVTLWGDKESGLREYSNRQWAGLIKGYYKPRWELFFTMLDKSLQAGTTPDLKVFDQQVKNWEWKWVNQHDNAYSAKTTGNSLEKAAELYKKYNQIIREAYAK